MLLTLLTLSAQCGTGPGPGSRTTWFPVNYPPPGTATIPAARRTPMDTPLPPPHPVDSLTAYELSRYRRQLEHALKALPGHAPARGQLQQRLADVMAEQYSRTTITGSSEQA